MRCQIAGFKKIETASFVSPKWVPQMADSDEVMKQIVRHPGVGYAALTPNMRGLERAIAAGADEIAIFGAATEGFSQANINCSIAESLQRFEPLCLAAGAQNIPVRGYISCVTDCPYEGAVSPAKVAEIASALNQMGCYEISLGDTLGHATPTTTSKMLEAVADQVEVSRLAGHFHDTTNQALDNIAVSLGYGVRTFDASINGLGGCPYAPGAAGNVATDRVVRLLEEKGYQTGIDLKKLTQAGELAKRMRS